jgi:hypothetical protein
MKMKIKTKNVNRNAEAVAENEVVTPFGMTQEDFDNLIRQIALNKKLEEIRDLFKSNSVGEEKEQIRVEVLDYDQSTDMVELSLNKVQFVEIENDKLKLSFREKDESSNIGDAVRLILAEGHTEFGNIVNIKGDKLTIKLLKTRKDINQRKKRFSKLVDKQIEYQGLKGVSAYASLEVFPSIVEGNNESITVMKSDAAASNVIAQEQEQYSLAEEVKEIKEVLGDGYIVNINERLPGAQLAVALMTGVVFEYKQRVDGDVDMEIRQAPKIRTRVRNFARNLKRSVRDAVGIDFGITTTILPQFVLIKDDKPKEMNFGGLARALCKDPRVPEEAARMLQNYDDLSEIFFHQITVRIEKGYATSGYIRPNSIKYNEDSSTMSLTVAPYSGSKLGPNPQIGSIQIDMATYIPFP